MKQIKLLSTSGDIILNWIPQNTFNNKSRYKPFSVPILTQIYIILWRTLTTMSKSLCNPFEGWAPVYFIHGCLIFKWVAKTQAQSPSARYLNWGLKKCWLLNSLAPGRPGCHFKTAIFNLVLLIGIFISSKDNAQRWMPRDITNDKSTIAQVMAWCRQATSHYLNQCWPSSMSPYGVTRPQWVNIAEAPTLQIQFQFRNILQNVLVFCAKILYQY